MFIFFKIFRDIFSRRAFKIKICAKYKINGIMLISLIKIFRNTLIFWINAAWMNIIAFKVYFQASITNNEKWAIPKLFFAWKILPHIFPRNTTFVPKFSMLPVDSVFSKHHKLFKKYSYVGVHEGLIWPTDYIKLCRSFHVVVWLICRMTHCIKFHISIIWYWTAD